MLDGSEEFGLGLNALDGGRGYGVAFPIGYDRFNREVPECLADAHGTHGGGATAGEGENVRRPTALHVDIHAPHNS